MTEEQTVKMLKTLSALAVVIKSMKEEQEKHKKIIVDLNKRVKSLENYGHV